MTYFMKFWDPLHVSGTAKARNFLACILATGGTNEKNAKLGRHGREQGHVTCFF